MHRPNKLYMSLQSVFIKIYALTEIKVIEIKMKFTTPKQEMNKIK